MLFSIRTVLKLIILKKLQAQEKTWTSLRSYLFVKEIYIFIREISIHESVSLSVPSTDSKSVISPTHQFLRLVTKTQQLFGCLQHREECGSRPLRVFLTSCGQNMSFWKFGNIWSCKHIARCLSRKGTHSSEISRSLWLIQFYFQQWNVGVLQNAFIHHLI